MPRAAFFSKETIIAKGLEIVRRGGEEALTARALSAGLGCSLSPIFTVFENMGEIKEGVRQAASDLFEEYVADVTDYMPAFKEFGLRLVRFAKEERNLFNLLFLSHGYAVLDVPQKAQECLKGIEDDYGLSQDQVAVLFRQMWIFACGLAVLGSRSPEAYPQDVVGETISLQFASQLHFIRSGLPLVNITPHLRDEGEKTTLDI
ncbi:MAG: hypothetical protein ACI395_04065 [Candidatus Cryptobacteroides sp.]